MSGSQRWNFFNLLMKWLWLPSNIHNHILCFDVFKHLTKSLVLNFSLININLIYFSIWFLVINFYNLYFIVITVFLSSVKISTHWRHYTRVSPAKDNFHIYHQWVCIKTFGLIKFNIQKINLHTHITIHVI